MYSNNSIISINYITNRIPDNFKTPLSSRCFRLWYTHSNKQRSVMAEAFHSTDSESSESWATPEDSLKYSGRQVRVTDASTGEHVFTGVVVPYTDLLGSGGILKPDPVRGMNNVLGAIRFPHDPLEFQQEMAKYRFEAVDDDPQTEV